ncbi:helix-turn-helix domain-containing protein [Polaromonas sp. P2-4]|nr:helix-turn-helix domain-containing protein [Polaromonas sp. P2-4]
MKTRKVNAANPESHRPDFVSSLAKGLEVLSAFERGDMLGNQELVSRTGLPKTTVSRLTGTLASLGYLRLDERTRKYMMGTRVLGMGASVQRHIGLQRIARPFMEALAEELDVTVILGARDRSGLVFLELIRPLRNALTVNTDAGSVVPIESTSIGQACLVAAPVTERVRVLEALRRRHPDDWDSVRKTIERARRLPATRLRDLAALRGRCDQRRQCAAGAGCQGCVFIRLRRPVF